MLARMPRTGQQVITPTLVNSEYCCIASYLKNCYLLTNSDYDEDCAYGAALEHSRNCFDMYMSDECESCYKGINLRKCFKTFFSFECENCVEVYFSKNLKGCSYCFGCVNLRNKAYHIFNTPRTKESYFQELRKINFGSYAAVLKIRKEAEEYAKKLPNRFMTGTHNINTTGEYIFHSKNVRQSHQVLNAEDCKFCHFLWMANTKDAYDFTMWGGDASMIYECMEAGGGLSRAKFCFECWCPAHDVQYCMELSEANSNLFGCYALRNKSYCILNKQYSKEEYGSLIPKIIQQMNEMPYISESRDQNLEIRKIEYKYGEFFPNELSPFAYNETIAQEYFPLTKETAHAKRYQWREPEERKYEVSMRAGDLPDHIRDATDKILKETIGCEHERKCAEQCTSAFRITPAEFEFYRKINISLPRLCPNCRHYARISQRNPLKLWKRKCQCAGTQSQNRSYGNMTDHFHGSSPCHNEFETSYVPDRPEIVHCEKCYQAEVI
ncbi:MAG: hypothetical protein G01um101433_905 [Parcubacteria group bacterium Gr01-1014_33]|nr:MAG: hypothetical protein G01um101433_905 [Parcubacteria group bacterium Gr01-1014_33]